MYKAIFHNCLLFICIFKLINAFLSKCGGQHLLQGLVRLFCVLLPHAACLPYFYFQEQVNKQVGDAEFVMVGRACREQLVEIADHV